MDAVDSWMMDDMEEDSTAKGSGATSASASSVAAVHCDLCGKSPSADPYLDKNTTTCIQVRVEILSLAAACCLCIARVKFSDLDFGVFDDLPWASHEVSKTRKIPVGPACWFCGTVAALAYPNENWTQIVSKAKSDLAFKNELANARSRLVKHPPEARPWTAEAVQDTTSSALVLRKSMIFIGMDEFTKRYGTKIPPEQELAEIVNERGQLEKGLIMEDSSYRKVELMRTTTLTLARDMATPQQMLRPGQNKELFKMLVSDEVNKMKQSFGAILNEKDLEEVVLKAQAAQTKATNAAATAAAAAAQEPAPLGTPDKRDRGGDLDEDPTSMMRDSPVQAVSAIPAPAWQSEREETKQSSSKGRGKGGKGGRRGRASGGRGGKNRGSSATDTSSVTGGTGIKAELEEGANSRRASGASTGSADAESGPPKKVPRVMRAEQESQAEKHLKELKAERALKGESVRGQLYQANRTLKSLQSSGQAESSECIQLEAHITFVELCEKMASIDKLPAGEKREADLREVVQQVPQLPQEFQLALIRTRVKEMKLESDEDATLWIQRINPCMGAGSIALRSCLES
eukprot:6492685-Amphidinium_carterae.4